MGIVFLNERNFFVKNGVVRKTRTMDEQNGAFREMKKLLLFKNKQRTINDLKELENFLFFFNKSFCVTNFYITIVFFTEPTHFFKTIFCKKFRFEQSILLNDVSEKKKLKK